MRNSPIMLVLALLIFTTVGLVPNVSHAGGKKSVDYYINFKCTTYKVKKRQKQRGKDKGAPSWVENNAKYRPCYAPVKEDGKTFAMRVLVQHLKPKTLAEIEVGADSDFNKLKKWADRNFEDPRK